MAIIRLKYRKINRGDYAKCWYCESNTHHSLTELDGSEIWCCSHCHKRYGKIYVKGSRGNEKKEKYFINIKGKNAKQGVFSGVVQ